MQEVDRRIFVNPNGGAWKGGMDKDSEERYVQNGYYRDARNISFMVNGDRFTVKNLKGNTSKSYTLNSGANTCIGSFDDKGNETVYYFIYNGSGDHEVLKYQYNSTVDAISQVAEGAGFAFEVDKLITSIVVVNDRFLVWGQEGQEIGCIDLENPPAAAISTAADRWEVELCKIPDLEPLYPMYVTDEKLTQNPLKSKQYQFRYYYVYEGGFRSTLSTISQCPVPDFSFVEQLTDGLPDNISYDNKIQIDVPQPSFDKVEKIVLLVREGNDDSTKDSNIWYEFGEILYEQFSATQPLLSFTFTGTEALKAFDPAESLTETTFFPKSCKSIVFLPSNVLGFLNFTESLDTSAVEPEVSIYPTYNAARSGGSTTTTLGTLGTTQADTGTFFNPRWGIELSTDGYRAFSVTGTPRVGDVIEIDFTLTYTDTGAGTPPTGTGTKDFSFAYVVKEDDVTGVAATDRNNVATKLKRCINALDTRNNGFGGIVAFNTAAQIRLQQGENQTNSPYGVSSDVTSFTSNVTVDYPSAFFPWEEFRVEKNFKRNAIHPFAIEYLDDKGRRSGAIPIGEVYVEGEDVTTNDAWVDMNLSIGHLAPSWATHYHILYAKNQTYEEFLQLPVPITKVLTGAKYRLDVFSAISTFNTEYQNTDAYNYAFAEGDRVRMLSRVRSGTRANYATQVDVPIIRADADGIYVDYELADLNPTTATTDEMVIEVYTPKANSNRLYYEIAYIGTVDTDGYHSGNVRDQDANDSALILLDNHGDTYQTRTISPAVSVGTGQDFYEAENVSSLYVSKSTDIGRSNVELESNEEITRGSGITWTQPITGENAANGLSVVLPTSVYNDFGSDFGSIQKAFLQQDRKLVIYFEDKVGYMGVFAELQKSPTGEISYATDALANQINYYAYDGGIGLNPESFAYYDTIQYFLSPRNNAVCRLANDGITEISKYGMASWFNENLDVKSNNLSGLITPAVYDERNESYVLSFRQQFNLTYVDVNPETSYGFIFTPDISGSYGEDLVQVGDTIIVTDTSTPANSYTITLTDVSYNSSNGQFTVAYSDTGTPIGSNIASAFFIRQVETVMFNEPANAWVSFLDLDTEYMCTCGVDYVSFRNGALWLHNVNSTYSSFYGSGVTAEVTVPFNAKPNQQKRYQTIEQESNSAWVSATDGDVSVEGDNQTSQLLSNFYSQYQPNEYAAAFRQDTSTPNRNHALTEGYDLRGKYMKVRLTNDASTQQKLASVAISYFISESSL